MKKFLLVALALVPLLSMAQDDMYFTPKKKATTPAVKRTTSYNNSRTANSALSAVMDTVGRGTPVVYNVNSRSEDDYNRRYTYNNGMTDDDWQTGGGVDSLTARVDSVLPAKARKFDAEDDENDYYYSRRLLRFHTPGYVSVRNPYYWDLVYHYGVYDYLDYWYTDPFYWHYGWGYGWSWGPWSCWYGPMWGWYHPYAYDYWGWGWGCGYYHGGYWGGGVAHVSHHTPRTQGVRYYDRNSFGNRTGAIAGRGSRTSAFAGGHTRTSRGYVDNRGSRTGIRGGSDYASRTGARYSSYGTSRVANVDRTASRGNYGNTSASRGGYMNTRTSARASSTYSSSAAARAARGGSSSSRSSNSSYTSTPSYNTPSRSSSSYSTSSSSVSSYSSGSSYSGGGSSRSGGGGFSGGGGSRGGGGRR